MRKSAALWLALGWIGFAALPWFFGDSRGAPPSPWPLNSGLVVGFNGYPWLIPLLLPLVAGSFVFWRGSRQVGSERSLVWIGLLGLTWVVLEGAAIDHRGWSAEWLTALLGAGPTQAGLGYGALITALACLMLGACATATLTQLGLMPESKPAAVKPAVSAENARLSPEVSA